MSDHIPSSGGLPAAPAITTEAPGISGPRGVPEAAVDDFPPVDPATERIVRAWKDRPAAPVEPPVAGRTNPDTRENQAVRAAAIQRYVADQAAVEEVKSVRRMLKYTGRPDVRWMFKWAGRAIKAYDMITAFIGAHLGGWVSRSIRDQRAWYCERCTHRRRRHSPNTNNLPAEGPLVWQDHCRGYDAAGRPCGCWDDPLWRPSSQRYQVWLRWLACPLGHWDRGSFVPDPPETLASERRF